MKIYRRVPIIIYTYCAKKTNHKIWEYPIISVAL